jgi:CPA1 family monovalent cation:H+ antiporter
VAWSNITPYIIRAVDRRPQQRLRRVGFRQRQPSAWAGFRGAVSLAAALSVPASLADGSALFGRDLIIVVTFGVILLTLVLQGLTLPAVLRFARFPMDDDAAKELNQAERAAVEAALRVLPAAAERLGVTDDIEHLVRAELDERRAELFTEPAGPESGVTAGDAPVSASIPAGDPAAADPLSVPSSHDARAAPASRPDPLTAPHSANGAAAPPSDRDGAATAHGDFDGSAETSPAAALTDAHNVPTDRSAAADGRDAGDVAVTPLADTSGLSRREQYQQLHSALVAEKRATVVRLRNNRKIDDIVLRRVEALLDAEDLRLGGSSNYLDE